MAQYIITIDDRDNGVMVRLAGPSAPSPANSLAHTLMTMAPHLLQALATRGFTMPDCQCERCQAVRPTKPTLH